MKASSVRRVLVPAVVGIAAFVVGRASVSVLPSPTSSPLPAPLPSPVDPRPIPRVPLPPPGDLASCRSELELAQALVATLSATADVARDGVPVRWSSAIPPELQPDAVKDGFRKIAEDCGISGLLGFDCAEAPCYALFDEAGASDLAFRIEGCPAWNPTWSRGSSMMGGTATCADGTTRSLLMLAPGGDPPPGAPDVDPNDNAHRRQYRREVAEARVCADGGGVAR